MKANWKKYLLYTGIIIVGGSLLFILIQTVKAKNTGFEVKTLWDWMELLIIPLVLAIGAFALNRSERALERRIADDRVKLEREIATDRQQESALQTYLDRMTDLLLNKDLRTTENEEVRKVARIRTLTVLRGLDAMRKGLVVRFIYEAGLINKNNPTIALADADLNYVNLVGAKLSDADLNKTNMIGANMTDAQMEGVELSHANLTGADLTRAELRNATMRGSNLTRAKLTSAMMIEAVLDNSILIQADLTKANLGHAEMTAVLMVDVNLTDASLYSANLSISNWKRAILVNTHLDGARMPDGTVWRYPEMNTLDMNKYLEVIGLGWKEDADNYVKAGWELIETHTSLVGDEAVIRIYLVGWRHNAGEPVRPPYKDRRAAGM